MKITIDRIENGIIVAELPMGKTVDLPGELFPGASEGDIYTVEKDVADITATKKRINEKMNKLFVD